MSTKTVLIVDDSAMMRRMLSATLRQGGYEVIESASGAEALGKAAERAFHLVITDFNMPQMNGAEVVRGLRAMPAYRSSPILVLTTEAAESAKQMAKGAGATGWMGKPFDPAALLDVVERVVSKELK